MNKKVSITVPDSIHIKRIHLRTVQKDTVTSNAVLFAQISIRPNLAPKVNSYHVSV